MAIGGAPRAPVTDKLERALKAAGLPTNPADIIGRLYRFDSEWDLDRSILVGEILAIGLSDKGRLYLYVSNPVFGGQLTYESGRWVAHITSVGDPNNRMRFYPGTFKLLDWPSTRSIESPDLG